MVSHLSFYELDLLLKQVSQNRGTRWLRCNGSEHVLLLLLLLLEGALNAQEIEVFGVAEFVEQSLRWWWW